MDSQYNLKVKLAGFHGLHVVCRESHRGVKDSKISGLRQMSSVYCNKEVGSRFGGDDRELHLGHVRPSEGIHQASRYMSLELGGGV